MISGKTKKEQQHSPTSVIQSNVGSRGEKKTGMSGERRNEEQGRISGGHLSCAEALPVGGGEGDRLSTWALVLGGMC